MKRSKLFIGIIIILLASVFLWKPVVRFIMKETDPLMKLRSAWHSNDTQYIKRYIMELDEKKFPDLPWATTSLSEETNLCFGDFDSRINWDTISISKKEVIKFNLISVWGLYSNSKFFMNKRNINLNLQYLYSDNAKYTARELDKIKQLLNH